MEFKDLQNSAIAIRQKYAHFERKRYGKTWTKEQIIQGLVGDLGDLMKLVMAKEGIRTIENVDEKLAHELSDCLWSILVLANEYDIDLEKSFLKTMEEIKEKLKNAE